MAPFIVLYKDDSNFESVDEFLKCEHSNESYSTADSYPVAINESGGKGSIEGRGVTWEGAKEK